MDNNSDVLSPNEMLGALKLHEHLLKAEELGYPVDKMNFIDGYLAALNMVTQRKFSFSGTRVYRVRNSRRVVVIR